MRKRRNAVGVPAHVRGMDKEVSISGCRFEEIIVLLPTQQTTYQGALAADGHMH